MNPFYIVGLLLLVVISLVINAKAAVWTLWIPIAIALVAQFTIFRVTAHLNLDHAEPINGARRRWLIRTILRAPVFFILFVYFFAIALTPSRIWAWYTSPIVVSHSEVLVALSLIAATGWSGSLIAFSISKMEAVSICGEISRRRNRVSEVSHAARFNATRVEVVFVGTIS